MDNYFCVSRLRVPVFHLEHVVFKGRLRAVLSLPHTRRWPSLRDTVADCLFLQGLSPDGHHIAVLTTSPTNKLELRLYAW